MEKKMAAVTNLIHSISSLCLSRLLPVYGYTRQLTKLPNIALNNELLKYR